jgi:hypothetical protein
MHFSHTVYRRVSCDSQTKVPKQYQVRGFVVETRWVMFTPRAQFLTIIYINFVLQRVNWFPLWCAGKLHYELTMEQYQKNINLETMSALKQFFNCVTTRSSMEQQSDTLKASLLKNSKCKKGYFGPVWFLSQFNLRSWPSRDISTFKRIMKVPNNIWGLVYYL